MAIGVLRILIVSSILGYVLVNGRREGARARRGAVCDDNGFDILSDLGGTPSTSPIPIDVILNDISDTGYIPGQSYNIRLRADTPADRFIRFMVQGRARSDNSPVGTFGFSGNSQPQCANDTASIHTNENLKRRVGLPWTAPPAGTGCICFKYSIVIDATTYWANLTTPCISENPQTAIQFNASGSVSNNDLTISLSATVDGVFECSLDGGSYQACSSGDVFQNLSVGFHTMNVRFTPDGYCQPLMGELSFGFTVIEISSRARIDVSGDTATITLDETVNGTYECRVDDEAFRPCNSGDLFEDLSEGSHTFDVRFTPAGSSRTATGRFEFVIAAATVFSVTATATYSGTTITVTYDVSGPAMCTCQLNSMTPVACVSGFMFTNVPNGEHSVTVVCTSTEDPSLMATAMVSGLQFLSVDLTLETAGTSITVIPQANIGATYRCSLDGGPFVECSPGFQFQGVSGGNHTVTVEATSLNGLTMVNVTGEIAVRGSDAILITDIRTDIDIPNQNYNFTFMINDKPNNLNITLLIDGSPIIVPFECRRISDEVCYCAFRIPNMEYATGAHTITFQSILNDEIRGSTTSRFIVTNTAVAQFRDTAYSVVEGRRNFSVVIEKDGRNAQMVTLSVQFLAGSAMSPSDYPLFQRSQAVRIPPGPSTDITVNFTINDDDIVECNETFTLSLVSLFPVRLQINPGRGQANVTIIDDDDTTVAFPGARSIIEGETGPVEVTYLGTITLNFTITVESYQCTDGDDAATPGDDYEPVNERLTFTPDRRTRTVDIMTREDTLFEGDERICLRLTNLTEPCLGSVIIGDDTIVTITEDDPPVLILQCSTNTSGNSIIGRTINLFYSVVSPNLFSPTFQCALNDGNFEPCPPEPPRVYGPLSYRNHTVTVKAQSAVTLEEMTIRHLVLMVQARLRVVNSSAIQISIQSTRSANYTCRLTGRPPFSCNDGDVIANLDPMMYTLMVEAVTEGNFTHRPQHASDIVGPITLTGGSALSTCAGMVNLTSTDRDRVSSYTARWRVRGDRVEFALTGEGDGWVGIGFSHNRMMAESDIILGAADPDDASNSFVDDRYAFTRDISVQPPIDPIQDIFNASASFEDGVTTVMFSRLKDTGDVNDISLSNCVFFLHAWGGGVTNFTSREISYHGVSRRFISNSLICLPTTFCPERFDCGNLTAPGNGTVTLSDGTLEGSIATYACNFGFRLVGNVERICQLNGTINAAWTGTDPRCERITCGDPGMPLNGSVSSNGSFVTSVATFACDFGFELMGDTQRVCQENGMWSNMVPNCTRITCGDPGVPLNGSVSSNGSFVTSVATFACDFGFELEGDTQRVCEENGMWTNMVPNCTRITCGDPGVPLNGSVSSNGSFVTSVATFTCDFGFELMGDIQRVCEENGMWTNMVPNCTRITCGDPGTVMNGMVTSNGSFVTSVATFTCNDGYMLVGDDQRVCQPNGSWSNMPPDCPPVDCGPPGVPENGNVVGIATMFGATIMYSCSPTYILCGNDTRECQANATWSGVVPDCIRSVATVENTSYIIPEDGGAVDIGILLDQPSCVTLNISVLPREQSPVDASTSDFDDTPIVVMIMPGDTTATVPIPITNDTVVEGPERFNVVLSTDGMDGFIIGTPGQSEVTIIDDGDTITVMFEMPIYNVTELEGAVEVCLLSSRNNEVPITVVVQPEEIGSAEEPGDFTLTSSMVIFGAGQRRACYNQSIVNDELPEPNESFIVRIVDNPDITVGTPGVSQINIIDDDGSLIMRNDTVIGDPLYTVPLQISDDMIVANPDVANASLCYEIHGSNDSIYNLVSDTCVSINAEYIPGNTSIINNVGRIGVLAVDDNGDCQRITIDVMQCTGTVGSTEVTQGSPYDIAGIRVRKGGRYFRIAVPNCERQDLVSWVICEQSNMLKFVITRGFNLQPTSHGLVGQFWNVPVELDEFTGTTPDNLTYYTVTVTPPDGDARSFVGHLYDVTWDFTPVPCVYAGNRNGGPVFEFDDPNDSVIEGNYTLYQVNDLFSTEFTYEQFDEARCN